MGAKVAAGEEGAPANSDVLLWLFYVGVRIPRLDEGRTPSAAGGWVCFWNQNCP